MSRIVCCEVCGNEFTAKAKATRSKYCEACRHLMYGCRQPCIKCGKMVNKTNLTGICSLCRKKMRKKRQPQTSNLAEKEIAKRYHISLARFKSLDKLGLFVLENEEYNRTHDAALSYGYYRAMRDGYI